PRRPHFPYTTLFRSFSAGLAAQQADGERVSALLRNVCVNGVQLHYMESGSGIPVVLIHGGLGDYREWNSQIGRISNHYRVIAYRSEEHTSELQSLRH